MSQLHVDLRHRPAGLYWVRAGSMARTATAGIGVLAGLVVYIAGAVGISAGLHLEGESAYWMATGVLFLLVVVAGGARFLQLRWLGSLSDRAIAVYVLVIGLGMFGFGFWRQIVFDQARRGCLEALAAADGVHARMRVLYGSPAIRLPTLSKSHPATTVTCERLVHS